MEIERPRLRSFDGKEQALPSWEGATTEDWLGQWAMNQMLINVSTRKFKRSVRLPEGEVPAPKGSGLSKSAASRRFVALSAARLKEWMARDLSDLGLLVIQIGAGQWQQPDATRGRVENNVVVISGQGGVDQQRGEFIEGVLSAAHGADNAVTIGLRRRMRIEFQRKQRHGGDGGRG